MSNYPPCPQCHETLTYDDGTALNCPMCGHAWTAGAETDAPDTHQVRDANGTPLADGDTVTVIKDLKLKGTSSVVKVGTKVKNIRLVEGDHNLDCKVPGVGAIGLKSEFVKKVLD